MRRCPIQTYKLAQDVQDMVFRRFEHIFGWHYLEIDPAGVKAVEMHNLCGRRIGRRLLYRLERALATPDAPAAIIAHIRSRVGI